MILTFATAFICCLWFKGIVESNQHRPFLVWARVWRTSPLDSNFALAASLPPSFTPSLPTCRPAGLPLTCRMNRTKIVKTVGPSFTHSPLTPEASSTYWCKNIAYEIPRSSILDSKGIWLKYFIFGFFLVKYCFGSQLSKSVFVFLLFTAFF